MRHTDTNTQCCTKCHCFSHSNREPYAIRALNDTFTNTVCNIYSYFNSNYDADSNCDTYCYCHSYTHVHAQTDTNTESCAHTETAAYSGTSPVALAWH